MKKSSIFKRINWALWFFAPWVFLGGCQQQETAQSFQISSPNERLQLVTKFDQEGALTYQLAYDGKPIIAPSKLGVVFKEGGAIQKGLSVVEQEVTEVDETWDVIAGMTKTSHNHYKQLRLELQEASGLKRKINYYFRVFDDGLGFRYEVPQQAGMEVFDIMTELTEFTFTADHECWAQYMPYFNYSYEVDIAETRIGQLLLDSMSNQTIIGGDRPIFQRTQDLIGIPLTVQVEDGPALAITEANLKDFAGMYLKKSKGDSLQLYTTLAPKREAEYLAVSGKTPVQSPWRVIMVGDTPADLIASNIILNLAEPLAIEDPSWIKPGKVSWEWWTDKMMIKDGKVVHGKMDNETIKYYIDFSAEMGFPYSIIDWNWYTDNLTQSIPELDIPELVEYAAEKNVGLFVWMYWELLDEQMEEALPQFAEWGIKGIKVDFTNSDDQFMVNWFWKLADATAKHKLLLNIHGAYKPTGIRRAYPNFMTREGVMGMEWARWTSYITPEHNVRLAFTRMLAGPMDYTAGAFDNVTREQFDWKANNYTSMGTRAHQLALFVIYESPLMVVCDYPGNIYNGNGAEFLKVVPSSYDEVHPIASQLADYVVLARKKGDDWFIGGITDWDARELSFPLNFLGEGEYEMTMYQDGLNTAIDAKDTEVIQKNVTAQGNLKVKMASGGGVAVQLRKVK